MCILSELPVAQLVLTKREGIVEMILEKRSTTFGSISYYVPKVRMLQVAGSHYGS